MREWRVAPYPTFIYIYIVVPWICFIQLTFDDDADNVLRRIDYVQGVLLQCIPAAESPNHMCPTSHLKLILFVAGSGLDNVDPERCVDRKSIR